MESLAQCEFRLGVHSYQEARFEEAISHFRRALEHDSSLSKAHLYIAVSYANQYIPGADTPDNDHFAEQAIAEYLAVTNLEPTATDDKVNSIQGLASLYFQRRQFEKAKDYNHKLIEVRPENPEPYFNIGVIDWTSSYAPRMQSQQKLGARPDQPLDAATCQKLAAAHMSDVEEGLQMLVKAIDLRPDYDDAMAYMNLLYRERAALQCNDPAARKRDLHEADRWVDQTLATKKAKTVHPQASPPNN